MKEIIPQEDWCYYSDLPSPMSYSASTDYYDIESQVEVPQETCDEDREIKNT